MYIVSLKLQMCKHSKVQRQLVIQEGAHLMRTTYFLSFSKILRDLRARLEMAVDHILEACSRIECLTDTDCTTTSNSSSIASDEMAAAASSSAEASHFTQPEFLMTSPLVTTIVRRELAVAIRDLMQHGMLTVIITRLRMTLTPLQ